MRTKDEVIMQKIVDFIDETYIKENEVPTMQEIADSLCISKCMVSRYVSEMSEKGMIEFNRRWRGIRTPKISKILSEIERVPFVGTIACGTPILAEQNIEGYMTVSGKLLGEGKFFALLAKGDSMINAGINNGDYVIVKQQDYADEGEIIVALIDDEATLKRYYKDSKNKKIRLHPENDDMEDMFYDTVIIQGVVKKIIKDCK